MFLRLDMDVTCSAFYGLAQQQINESNHRCFICIDFAAGFRFHDIFQQHIFLLASASFNFKLHQVTKLLFFNI
jgi:hypothetical protein